MRGICATTKEAALRGSNSGSLALLLHLPEAILEGVCIKVGQRDAQRYALR